MEKIWREIRGKSFQRGKDVGIAIETVFVDSGTRRRGEAWSRSGIREGGMIQMRVSAGSWKEADSAGSIAARFEIAAEAVIY